MSKRDDDSQSDMEVGMTTAERRRRRRRGGLRVPSDNVPRQRAPTQPGRAGAGGSGGRDVDRVQLPTRSHDALGRRLEKRAPTVIDPVINPDRPSAPVEQADFEMKTREMNAVDLKELGLSNLMPGGLAMGRATLRDLEPVAMSVATDGEIGGIQHELTDPDAVEVNLDASGVEIDGVVDAGITLDPDGDGRARRVQVVDADLEIDSAEPTAIHQPVGASPSSRRARRPRSCARCRRCRRCPRCRRCRSLR